MSANLDKSLDEIIGSSRPGGNRARVGGTVVTAQKESASKSTPSAGTFQTETFQTETALSERM